MRSLLLVFFAAFPVFAADVLPFRGEAKFTINGIEIKVPFSGTYDVPGVVDPPPVDDEPVLPDPIRTINVTPENAIAVLSPKPRPGDHYVFASGVYEMSNLLLGRGEVVGTADNPVAYISDGDVLIQADRSIGRHDAIWRLKGNHVWIQGLLFGPSGGGNQVAVISGGSWLSTDVVFKKCNFVRGDGKSVIAQGHRFKFFDCEFRECCQRNPLDSGPQAAVCTTWFYQDAAGKTQLSRDILWRRCELYRNRGEGLHPSYCHGAVIEDCLAVDGGRFVVFYGNNTSDFVIRRNRILSIDPMLSPFGNPPRAIDAAIEGGFAFENQNGNADYVIIDNEIDGGPKKGIITGIQWSKTGSPSTQPWASYTRWRIEGNTIKNTQGPAVKINARIPTAYEPEECFIDLPSSQTDIAEPQFWTAG